MWRAFILIAGAPCSLAKLVDVDEATEKTEVDGAFAKSGISCRLADGVKAWRPGTGGAFEDAKIVNIYEDGTIGVAWKHYRGVDPVNTTSGGRRQTAAVPAALVSKGGVSCAEAPSALLARRTGTAFESTSKLFSLLASSPSDSPAFSGQNDTDSLPALVDKKVEALPLEGIVHPRSDGEAIRTGARGEAVPIRHEARDGVEDGAFGSARHAASSTPVTTVPKHEGRVGRPMERDVTAAKQKLQPGQ
eukprot:TRINITY_DN12546_c0_g1_i1.p1 TRINITY_DN12546_c0_g1~~TRINITY_DN12546_c0_g1_i1.p1  ORF type:complete len:247 (-),score=36.82 TRINITY_DN12546_c0_g1_i1:169-909(-)